MTAGETSSGGRDQAVLTLKTIVRFIPGPQILDHLSRARQDLSGTSL